MITFPLFLSICVVISKCLVHWLIRFSKARMERGEFGMNCLNPGSRQIYLTFPADSTFKEEDVSNYFRCMHCPFSSSCLVYIFGYGVF